MSRFIVGVDIDGVLGNQVVGVLPRILEKYGIELKYKDVIHWRLPIGEHSDIAQEIEAALLERDFVLGMPVHAGAREMIDALHELGLSVAAVTARRREALNATEEWLRKSGLRFDEILLSEEAKKGAHETHVLVDDYIGNIIEFTESTDGAAILVDQPWNQDRSELAELLRDKRVVVVSDLREVAPVVKRVRDSYVTD